MGKVKYTKKINKPLSYFAKTCYINGVK